VSTYGADVNASQSPPPEPESEPRRSGKVGVFDRPSWFVRNRPIVIGVGAAIVAALLLYAVS
jgi:hypothetical protein